MIFSISSDRYFFRTQNYERVFLLTITQKDRATSVFLCYCIIKICKTLVLFQAFMYNYDMRRYRRGVLHTLARVWHNYK